MERRFCRQQWAMVVGGDQGATVSTCIAIRSLTLSYLIVTSNKIRFWVEIARVDDRGLKNYPKNLDRGRCLKGANDIQNVLIESEQENGTRENASFWIQEPITPPDEKEMFSCTILLVGFAIGYLVSRINYSEVLQRWGVWQVFGTHRSIRVPLPFNPK